MKSLLKLALLGAAAAVPALAAEIENKTPLTINVVATRTEQSNVRLPASVRVITRGEIEASGASQTTDVLRIVGSIQMTDLYGDGVFTQADMRGFGDATNATTLVLVDGRRLNNADGASPDLNSVSLKDVERIEIIEGSAGALYGEQAVGGVINIVTRKPDGLRINAEASAGSYDAYGAAASVEDRIKGFSYRVSGEQRGSDNYRDHNHHELKSLLARGGYDWSSGGVFAEAGRVEQDFELPGALNAAQVMQNRRQVSAEFAGDFSDRDTNLVRFGFRQNLFSGWDFDGEATRRNSKGVFRTSFIGFAVLTDNFQTRDVRSFSPRVIGRTTLPTGELQTTLGADVQRTDYLLLSVIGPQSVTQHMADAYAQLIVPVWHGVDLTLGARQAHVRNEVFDNFIFTQVTPLLDDKTALQGGIAWRPTDGLRLFTRYDENFRFAKVEEYTNAGAAPGSGINPLSTQRGKSYDAGAEWNRGGLLLRGSLFRLDSKNEIAFNPATFTSINLDRTRRDGVLLDGRLQVSEIVTLTAAGQYLGAKVTQGTFQNKAIPMVARVNGKAGISLRVAKGLSTGLETQVTGHRAFSGDFDNSLNQLPSFAVVNASLQWEWKALRVGARINNLLDREYSEYGASGGFPEQGYFYTSPERNFSLNIGMEL